MGNDVSGNSHWLKTKLEGVKSNRGAISARVTHSTAARYKRRRFVSQSNFYSASDSRLHFGLGAANTADLTIRWLNGNTEQITHVGTGQLVFIPGRVRNREKGEAQAVSRITKRSFQPSLS